MSCNTKTLPSPHPYYEVIVNNTSAYLIVHVKDPGAFDGVRLETWKINGKSFEKAKRNPQGIPRHNWQDYVDLATIQTIYFELLDSYREDAKVIDLAHARKVADGDIPF